jgi:hypothetical protein
MVDVREVNVCEVKNREQQVSNGEGNEKEYGGNWETRKTYLDHYILAR